MVYQELKSENYELLGGINSKASPYVNGPYEFRDITNLNFFRPGSLTQRQGTTLYVGASVLGRITGIYEYEKLDGSSYLIATANTVAYTVSNSFNSFKTGLTNGAIFDFVTFVDYLFASNGAQFFKYNGSNTSNFSLPPGATGWGVTSVIGGGLSGTYVAAYGYINERGYVGPASNGITITLNGITFGSFRYVGVTTPSDYGINFVQQYRTEVDGLDLTGTTQIPSGSATFLDTGLSLTSELANSNLFFTMAPKYIELYNNQLFLAGFSSALSTAYWSQIGEPEAIDPTFFAEFRTNDGDRITGMKSFIGSLIVTKFRSCHKLTGDNPSNFLLQEISDQYGCLSNRTLITFEDRCWWLDSKGICEYDGANIRIVSTKVEPIFNIMNIDAAIENAVAIHYRKSNEIWFCIPTGSSEINNTIVVFDYVSNAWTKYEGVDVSSIVMGQGHLNDKFPIWGGYTGNIFNFGASLASDNGRGITTSFDSYFLAARGQTTENMYRRFYLNLDPISVTLPIELNFQTNYGATIQLTRTMYSTPFQSRIDFGLPARSIQVNMNYVSTSFPITINGFTFESRYQRAV